MSIVPKIKINGLMINYFTACKRELWFYSRNLHFSDDENIKIGKILSQRFYKNKNKKVVIDDLISPDFFSSVDKPTIYEIKKSRKLYEAARNQILYYMWYLKYNKGLLVDAYIVCPQQKYKERVYLNEKNEKKIEGIIKGIIEVVSLPFPPPIEKKPYCKKCSYFEFCQI